MNHEILKMKVLQGFLEKARSFQIKYKPWAECAWVSASPIYCGFSRDLFYTQKDQLAIQTKQNTPNQDYASHTQSMKMITYKHKSLIESCFKLHFFTYAVLASRLSVRYVNELYSLFSSTNPQIHGVVSTKLICFFLLLTYKLVKYSQEIANKSFINIHVESRCSIAI